jgi:hypothetical protein
MVARLGEIIFAWGFVRTPNNSPHFHVVLACFELFEPAALGQNSSQGDCAFSISCGRWSELADFSYPDYGPRPAVYKKVKKLLDWGRFVISRWDDRLQ